GRTPSAAIVLKLRQQATLETRPDKQQHSLAQLSEEWRDRARAHVGQDTLAWVRGLPRGRGAALTSDQLTAGDVQRWAEHALEAVAAKRATFSRWNLYAETQRQLHAVRFAAT